MSRFDSLAKYRVEGDTEVHPDAPSGLVPTKQTRVLCLDQALATTGWVLMDTTEGAFRILDSGVHRTSPAAKTSLEDSYARGEVLNALLHQQVMAMGDTLTEVVYEMPVVGPRKTRNAEAAHVAVMAVRLACGWLDIPSTMVNVQQARKVLTGSAKADKGDIRAVVEEHADIVEMPYRNEHTFDAAGLGMAYTLGDR